MKKINILSILGFFIIVVVLFIIKFIPTESHYKTVKFSGTNVKVKAEIADTIPKQIEGLMSKESLPYDKGMLFIFNKEDYHRIWMMNMSFPIDILWVNKDLEIVHIVEGALPCKIDCQIYSPSEKALYVLEVNSGFVAKNKVQTGDSIVF